MNNDNDIVYTTNLLDEHIMFNFLTLDEYIKVAYGYHIDFVNPISNFTSGCWLESIIMYLYSIDDTIGDYMTNYLDFFYLKMMLCENITDSNDVNVLLKLIEYSCTENNNFINNFIHKYLGFEYFFSPNNLDNLDDILNKNLTNKELNSLKYKIFELKNNNIYIHYKPIDELYTILKEPLIYHNIYIYKLLDKISQIKINFDNIDNIEKNNIYLSINNEEGHMKFVHIYNNNEIIYDNNIKINNFIISDKYSFIYKKPDINNKLIKLTNNIIINNKLLNSSNNINNTDKDIIIDKNDINEIISNLDYIGVDQYIKPIIYDYNKIIILNNIELYNIINNIIKEYKKSRLNIKYQKSHISNNINYNDFNYNDNNDYIKEFHYNCKYNYIINLVEKELNNIIYLDDKQKILFYKNLLYIIYKYNEIINNNNEKLLEKFKNLLIYYTFNFNIILNNYDKDNNIFYKYCNTKKENFFHNDASEKNFSKKTKDECRY